jgi:uncharacterized coiled-coil DUF342 family protein
MTDNENKFWAFLSYCEQDNQEKRSDTQAASHLGWGDWLHDSLKTFSVPAEFAGQINSRGEVIPDRIQPIFREDRELPEDGTLSADVRTALEQSICLVVICSPRSARSRQVNEAVRYFKQLGRSKHILPIVVAGEPHASDGLQSGATPEDECFVPALRHPVQPDGTLDTTRRAVRHIFVDARHGTDKREILANDSRNAEADLEMAKIQLIALLIGVGFNGLWWREQKRHFFDFAEAQKQAREALNQVEEVRRQLQAAQHQTREAQQQALETQNLPRDIHGQIQEAQNQAVEAQNQTREAQRQLQEFQAKVRETQAQLEETRHRLLAAESKFLEAQNQVREAQNQLEMTRDQTSIQARETQDTSSRLEEIRQQAQEAHNKFLAAQSEAQEFQSQARSAQSQLDEARNQVLAAEGKITAAQHQAREAQDKFQEIQIQTRDAQDQIKAAQKQVLETQIKSRAARRLTRVFAILAALALLAAGMVASMAVRHRKVTDQALARATAEAAGDFSLAQGGSDKEPIRQTLQNIAGAKQDENRRISLDRLATSIPRAEIPEALKASSEIMNDQQRSHFQKWLLLRLSWADPASAMTSASAMDGNIVNDAGQNDSVFYFQLAVLDNWMKMDLAGAVRWVCQLPDAGSRQRAADKIIQWVQSPPDSESKIKTLGLCIDELAKTDISRALELAESLPAGDWRSAVIAGLFNNSPQEIMQPRTAPFPWPMFLVSSYLGNTAIFPIETGSLSNLTPDSIQPKLGE